MALLPDDPGCSACACDQSCVDDGTGSPVCMTTLPNRIAVPCEATGGCDTGQACVSDTVGGTTCMAKLEDSTSNPCGACPEFEICVDDAGTPTCRLSTPAPSIVGLPEGNGLFTSLLLHGDTPTFIYYDGLRHNLRGAVALFTYDQPLSSGFTVAPIACDTVDDLGQHATLAENPLDGTLAAAFQGNGGETLDLYQTSGADLFIGDLTPQSIDDGIRDTRIHLVGAHVTLAFDANGIPYVAYADQTDNDLLLAYRPVDEWLWITADSGATPTTERLPLLDDGAYGSFAKMIIVGNQAYLSSYLRARDSIDRDASRLILNLIDLP